MKHNENDIIAAIATAYGHGAIGIVRMSGDGASALLQRVFLPAESGRRAAPFKLESHRMYYGSIHAKGEMIDEVMVCPMLAPRSYTKEDTVEIYAHGGMVVLRSVLDAVLQEGARLAEPGEFTKRAFLNGRINLTQAEAVMDLINAGSDAARRAGLRQLGGGLGRRIEAIRDKILHWLAHIELSIDYPEHEEEAKTVAQILAEGGEVVAGLEALYKTAAIGRMLQDGIKTAIVGRPNAGKSTLLNAILSEDRAIVHEQAGTTRDILTERVVVGDIPLLLMDTAGLRETNDPIEKIGVEKTLQAATDAELILYVIDRTQGLTAEDEKMLQSLKDKPVIVLLNKSDLPGEKTNLPTGTAIEISTKTGEGLDKLYEQISHQLLSSLGDVNAALGDTHSGADIITRERHRVLIEQAIQYVRTAMAEIE
ncbi:MAG: tRNA uridine-5-carboxymethylaminomethyl(34) synthesis GTPase MnmE, partial [Defluviitaleaceae bacterium]|nr:tRNA uridine-5-carboxymethylaminomethyl(34) synthesis GTPase MnmE [Defluviitaleaceae bacterium]